MTNRNQLFKLIFWGGLTVLFIIMLIIVPQYGITGDEVTQWKYGDFVWKYIKSFGADKAVLTDPFIEQNALKYYGGFFDGFAAMLFDIFNPKDEFLVRHYWNMIFGFAAILFGGLIAKELAGWRAAVITVVFLVFTPRFFGPIFNNPKDIPFATGYLAALLCSIKWLKIIERPSWKVTILLGLSIALAISIRIGGVLIIAYLGLFYIIELWRVKGFDNKTFIKSAVHLVTALLIGWIVGCLWWPYALENMISHPVEALKVMTDYPLNVATLYKGEKIRTIDVPRDYLPTWLGIATPIYILLGFAGSLFFILPWTKKKKNSFYLFLLFATVFPVAYIVYKKSVVYDGMRHILFVLPLLSLFAALFFNQLLTTFKDKKTLRYLTLGVMIILIGLPARFTIANHPNQDVYFNEFIGGIKGAYGNYETDYYSNSLKEGLNWLINNRLKNEHPAMGTDSIIIASNAPAMFEAYKKTSPVPFKFVYVRYYERNTADWDYGVFMSRFLDKEQLLSGYFPGDNPIYMVTADGIPLTTVLANDPQRNGLRGTIALESGNDSLAAHHFGLAVKQYPTDIELWRNLAIAQIQSGNINEAEAAIKKAYSLSSLDVTTADITGQIYMHAKKYKEAAHVFGKMARDYPEIAEGWLGFGQAQIGLKNYPLAVENIKKAIEIDPGIAPQGLTALAYVYQQMGDYETAQKLLDAARQGQQ